MAAQRSKPGMSETALKTAVLKLLRAYPHSIWFKEHQSQFTGAGKPDISGVFYGRAVYIELKAPGKYDEPWRGITKIQAKCIQDLQHTGAFVCVTDMLEEVQTFMECIKELVLE